MRKTWCIVAKWLEIEELSRICLKIKKFNYCQQRLEDASVKGSLEIQQDEYKKAEKRIIGEANKKRQTMLIGGGIVLLIGLAIFVK